MSNRDAVTQTTGFSAPPVTCALGDSADCPKHSILIMARESRHTAGNPTPHRGGSYGYTLLLTPPSILLRRRPARRVDLPMLFSPHCRPENAKSRATANPVNRPCTMAIADYVQASRITCSSAGEAFCDPLQEQGYTPFYF